jgi:hypothetical protein
VAVFIHGAEEFGFAEGALETGEKMRKGLGVIPYVGARAVATATVGETSFPAPEIAVFKTEDGRRFENGEIGGDGVEDLCGERGGKESVFECNGARA